MTALLRAAVPYVVLALALAACPLRGLATSPQQPGPELPVSLDRIRERVEQAPTRPLDVRVAPSVPLAKFTVDVTRWYVPTLEDQLHKAFDLTPLQRQSQEWASRCCGLDLDALVKPIGRALKRRQERRIRGQIARELAGLRAAADK